jgi:NAD(P)-dependent dehydrogenase (short-subunit alcohol dehydrogenase family)
MMPRTPPFRLDGERALVTGAGRGLGAALAAALAEAGAHVLLAARPRARSLARLPRSGRAAMRLKQLYSMARTCRALDECYANSSRSTFTLTVPE